MTIRINTLDVLEIKLHGQHKRHLEIKRLNISKHYVVEEEVGAVFVGKPEDCLTYCQENSHRHRLIGQNPEVTR